MILARGGLFQGAVKALNLPVGPGMGGLGKTVLSALLVADTAKNVPPGIHLVGHIAELGTVVGQYFMHFIGDGSQHPMQKSAASILVWLGAATRQRPACWCGQWPQRGTLYLLYPAKN